MGKITPLAGVGWPVRIGLLSNWVAYVVQEVMLKGLIILMLCNHVFVE